MHDYKGTHGNLYTPTNLPNKGVWVTPQVPDDGNDRSAATVAVGTEGVADRTVYLAFHMVDGLVDGTYPANIGWTGLHNFAAPVTMTSTLAVTGNVTLGAGLTVGGNATLNGLFTANDPATFTDKVVRIGDNAYHGGRKGNGPDGTFTVDVWKKDLWLVTLSGDAVWTLSAPPNDEILDTTIILENPGAGHELALVTEGAVLAFATLSNTAGDFLTVILKYDGDAWRHVGGVVKP